MKKAFKWRPKVWCQKKKSVYSVPMACNLMKLFQKYYQKKKKNPWTKSMVALDWTRNYFCFLCRKLTPRTRER
jgi:hypothetical protein